MVCLKCDKHLKECTCPDIDKRLATLIDSQYVLMEFCTNCEKHKDRCKCPHPKLVTNKVFAKLLKQRN